MLPIDEFPPATSLSTDEAFITILFRFALPNFEYPPRTPPVILEFKIVTIFSLADLFAPVVYPP